MYVQSTIFKTMMIERNQNSNLILVNMERKESPEMSIKRIAYETPEESVCCLRDEDARILTRRKRVFFYPEVIMIETLHHKNYTKEEKMRCWYSKSTDDSDFMEMKKELQRTIHLMKKIMNSTKHTLEEYEKHSKDRYSFRGLENRINSSKRKLVREGARSSVFQQIQTRNDDDEPASIAEQYCHYAKQCAFEAYDMGLMDEVEAFSTNTTRNHGRR